MNDLEPVIDDVRAQRQCRLQVVEALLDGEAVRAAAG